MQFIIVTSFREQMAGSMDHEACYTANDNDGFSVYDIGKNQSLRWLSHPLQWTASKFSKFVVANESMNNNQCCIRIDCRTTYKTI